MTCYICHGFVNIPGRVYHGFNIFNCVIGGVPKRIPWDVTSTLCKKEECNENFSWGEQS
ncbi:hypothetical protein HOLleu_38833 [Holothuria leucospilota]|uniref:Uncharacterized protein n=1 Tax=Holothuria leucospilota TaxID=206669 RepID=A0A9Q0YMH9_HOLLE|nr:hypothetical protein HOLleu_38833 [Holothuria leucospilota]